MHFVLNFDCAVEMIDPTAAMVDSVVLNFDCAVGMVDSDLLGLVLNLLLGLLLALQSSF